jgi:predicted GNAT family N-acyltransferase
MSDRLIIKAPSECTAGERGDFASLVLAGGEVAAQGLEDRVNAAQRLIFIKRNGCLTAVAAIKKPKPGYRRGVFEKAHSPRVAAEYRLELGWVFVMPSARGTGLSHVLVGAALGSVSGEGIFATSRSDNVAMHKALLASGFTASGKPYASSRGDYQLVLFTKIDANGA